MITVKALHKFMTRTGQLIEEGTILTVPDNDEVRLWIRRQLVEIVPENKGKTRRKKN